MQLRESDSFSEDSVQHVIDCMRTIQQRECCSDLHDRAQGVEERLQTLLGLIRVGHFDSFIAALPMELSAAPLFRDMQSVLFDTWLNNCGCACPMSKQAMKLYKVMEAALP
jgi:hypothetical protein